MPKSFTSSLKTGAPNPWSWEVSTHRDSCHVIFPGKLLKHRQDIHLCLSKVNMQMWDLGQTAGMFLVCLLFLYTAMVIRPLSTAEHLLASPPAVLSGLQLTARKEAHLQLLAARNKQHLMSGVSCLCGAKQITREE